MISFENIATTPQVSLENIATTSQASLENLELTSRLLNSARTSNLANTPFQKRNVSFQQTGKKGGKKPVKLLPDTTKEVGNTPANLDDIKLHEIHKQITLQVTAIEQKTGNVISQCFQRRTEHYSKKSLNLNDLEIVVSLDSELLIATKGQKKLAKKMSDNCLARIKEDPTKESMFSDHETLVRTTNELYKTQKTQLKTTTKELKRVKSAHKEFCKLEGKAIAYLESYDSNTNNSSINEQSIKYFHKALKELTDKKIRIMCKYKTSPTSSLNDSLLKIETKLKQLHER